MKIARKRPREKFRQIHLQMKARIRNHGDGEGSNIIWGVTKLSSMQRLLFFGLFLILFLTWVCTLFRPDRSVMWHNHLLSNNVVRAR
jgi:hypothetical protein